MIGCSGKSYHTPGEWIRADILGDKTVKSINEKYSDSTGKSEFTIKDGKKVLSTEYSQFRGIYWGEHYENLKYKLVPSEGSDGNNRCYNKKEDKLTVGNIQINKVIYCFYNNEFGSAMFNTLNISNFMQIRDTLTEKYGKPHQSNKYIDNYYWNVEDKLSILAEYNSATNVGTFFFSFRDVSEKIRIDRKKEIKSSVSDI